jgi:predicted PurR-regulated permease PerM
MNQDRTIKTLLFFCATILILGGLYLAQPIIAPVAFSLFVVAVVWPIQQALQSKFPSWW